VQVATQGKQQPVNKLSDQLRRLLVEAGFTEALTFALVPVSLLHGGKRATRGPPWCPCSLTCAVSPGQCKHADNFSNLRRPDDGKTAALIGNPKTQDFQVRPARAADCQEGFLRQRNWLRHPVGVPRKPPCRAPTHGL
jgi:hypothetical protein